MRREIQSENVSWVSNDDCLSTHPEREIRDADGRERVRRRSAAKEGVVADLHHPVSFVVHDGDHDRELLLHCGRDVCDSHREATVTADRDDGAVRMRDLQSKGGADPEPIDARPDMIVKPSGVVDLRDVGWRTACARRCPSCRECPRASLAGSSQMARCGASRPSAPRRTSAPGSLRDHTERFRRVAVADRSPTSNSGRMRSTVPTSPIVAG